MADQAVEGSLYSAAIGMPPITLSAAGPDPVNVNSQWLSVHTQPIKLQVADRWLPHLEDKPTVFVPPPSDKDLVAVHDAFLAGDSVKLGRYARRLKKTPLEVYASYYQLRLALDNTGEKPVKSSVEEAVHDFLSRPEDTPLIDMLRNEWLKLLGNKQRWDTFDAEFPRLINEDTELTCYALQSRKRNHELPALHEARKLWFSGKGQPESCAPLFEAALTAGIISEQEVSQRLRLALEMNNISLAMSLAERLEGTYPKLTAALRSASADPDRYSQRLTPLNASE